MDANNQANFFFTLDLRGNAFYQHDLSSHFSAFMLAASKMCYLQLMIILKPYPTSITLSQLLIIFCENLSLNASAVLLMRPKKYETAVHGC